MFYDNKSQHVCLDFCSNEMMPGSCQQKNKRPTRRHWM